MIFDVELSIKETTTGIGTDVHLRLQVERAESGLYIASCPMDSPLIAGGASPQYAILQYLQDRVYERAVEAEQIR